MKATRNTTLLIAALVGSTLKLSALPNEAAPAGESYSTSANQHLQGSALTENGSGTPPKVIRTLKPTYPFAMRRAGIQGRVVVNFVVDTNGNVRIPFATESTHPGFRNAAIDAVAEWKFKPGKRGGRKVNTRMQVPIIFSIEGEAEDWGWRVERPKKFPDSVPPEMHWDEPPKIRNYTPPIYPRKAVLQKQEGRVEIGFLVGPSGQVIKAEAISGQNEALVGAAIAAVHTFAFDAPRKDGKPCGALLSIRFDYKLSPRGDAQFTPETARLAAVIEKGGKELVLLKQLDEMPRPLHRVAPVAPPLLEFEEPVTVTVDFVINRRGAVELPEARDGVEPALAHAAVQAIAAWQFMPPMVDGKPVDAKAVIPIVFNPATSN